MAVEAIDQAKAEAFVGRVFGDTSAAMTTIMAAIGDRHGLFKELAASGPATSAELAARAGIDERYAREWLGGDGQRGLPRPRPGRRGASRCRPSTRRRWPRSAARSSSAASTTRCSTRSR